MVVVPADCDIDPAGGATFGDTFGTGLHRRVTSDSGNLTGVAYGQTYVRTIRPGMVYRSMPGYIYDKIFLIFILPMNDVTGIQSLTNLNLFYDRKMLCQWQRNP